MISDVFDIIKTDYQGCRFWSRNEARWAIFLDAIGCKWTYQKEAFDIDGKWYQPDFWVEYEHTEPGWGFWVEVKPAVLTEQQSSTLARLTKLSGHRTYAICGSPWPGEHRVSVFEHHNIKEPASIPAIMNGVLQVAGYTWKGRPQTPVLAVEPTCSRPEHVSPLPFPVAFGYVATPEKLEAAFRSARGYRFERGRDQSRSMRTEQW